MRAQILVAVGTVYPAYATFKVTAAGEAEAMACWLHYWFIFACLSLVERGLDLAGAYLPFYYEAKILFFLWLYLDKFQGATFLFKKFLEPSLLKHQPAIDENLDFVVNRAKALNAEDMRKLVEWAQTKGQGAIATAAAKGAAPSKPTEKPASPEPSDEAPVDVGDVDVDEKKEK